MNIWLCQYNPLIGILYKVEISHFDGCEANLIFIVFLHIPSAAPRATRPVTICKSAVVFALFEIMMDPNENLQTVQPFYILSLP